MAIARQDVLLPPSRPCHRQAASNVASCAVAPPAARRLRASVGSWRRRAAAQDPSISESPLAPTTVFSEEFENQMEKVEALGEIL
uniref:Uncharacterized protein n=1 Tax=Oryza meridionalis TaxID=40149 RepID=A0A0E0E355_9ORYZ